MAARYGSNALGTRAVRETRDASRALHHLTIGRQRSRAYAAARRDAARGRVVVLDRFPCGTLVPHADGALLDGPQIAATAGPRPNRAVRLLALAEQHLYGRFAPPDSIVVLDVDPATAFARKPDHDPGVLRAKSSAAEVLSRREGRAGPRIRTIDANQSFDRVVSDLKTELWRVV
jgi:thymidylate kinase